MDGVGDLLFLHPEHLADRFVDQPVGLVEDVIIVIRQGCPGIFQCSFDIGHHFAQRKIEYLYTIE